MTGWRKRQVVEMAREAGICTWLKPPEDVTERLERFAELVRADEREACAKVCEERIEFWQRDDGRRYEDEYCAAAIRARGDKHD